MPLLPYTYIVVATPQGDAGDVVIVDIAGYWAEETLQLAVYPRCVNRAVFALTTRVEPRTRTITRNRDINRLDLLLILQASFKILQALHRSNALWISSLYYHMGKLQVFFLGLLKRYLHTRHLYQMPFPFFRMYSAFRLILYVGSRNAIVIFLSSTFYLFLGCEPSPLCIFSKI